MGGEEVASMTSTWFILYFPGLRVKELEFGVWGLKLLGYCPNNGKSNEQKEMTWKL